MRVSFSLAALAASASLACSGGGAKPPQHPVLPQDYTSVFVGTWNGSGTVTMAGRSQTTSGSQPITRTGFNTLGITGMCPGADGTAGVDSPTTFSIDPMTCAPQAQPCGPVTVAYASGNGTVTGGTLTLTVTGTASGCGQSYPYTLTFTGTLASGGAGAPVAVIASPSVSTTPGVPVTLDASASCDPDGLALTYAWSITSQPAGAALSLTGADTARPTFSANTTGSYTVQVVVTASDGQTGTASAWITVATRSPPSAVLASTSVGTTPDVPVTLDASGSMDPYGEALTFAWTVASAPTGASATLTGADTARPTFASATLGSYLVRVTVTTADLRTASASATVTVAPPITALAHEVASARYSAALDRLVLTDGSPSALYVYDPATATESSVALPLAPTCLSLSPDGTHALVGHDAWVSYVDLAGPTVEKRIPVSLTVGDCILAGNGWAYLFPQSYSQALSSLELATGVETRASMIYEGSSGVLGPDGLSMYAVTVGLSPAQIYRYDVSGGVAVEKWGSPYWGDHSMSAPMWLTADGTRILTAAATAFRVSSVQSQDLLYAGTLSGQGSIRWLDSSATEIAAIPSPGYFGPPTADTTVELFNTEYLGHVDRIVLPSWVVGSNAYAAHGRFVFYGAGGTKKHVVIQADGSSGLLHDTAVLTY